MTERKRNFSLEGGGEGGRVGKEGIVVPVQALELAELWCTGYGKLMILSIVPLL